MTNLADYHKEEKRKAQEHFEKHKEVLQELIGRGYSEIRIAEWLTKKGYKTRTGRSWSPTGVHRMLKALQLRTRNY